jgi:hypothetical protein
MVLYQSHLQRKCDLRQNIRDNKPSLPSNIFYRRLRHLFQQLAVVVLIRMPRQTLSISLLLHIVHLFHHLSQLPLHYPTFRSILQRNLQHLQC